MRIGTTETVRRIALALDERQPFSLVRMGDGEYRAMMAMKAGRMPDGRGTCTGDVPGIGNTYTVEDVASHYALFVAGLQKVDVLGLWFWRHSGDRMREAIMEEVDRLVGMDERVVTDTFVSNYMMIGGQFWDLVEGRRVLIVNDHPAAIMEAFSARRYSEQMRCFGIDKHPPWNIVGGVRVDCVEKVARDAPDPTEEPEAEWRPVMQYVDEAAAYEFDIALVGFSWRSMIVCPMLAERTGKVVLDMGHTLNEVWMPRPEWTQYCSWEGLIGEAKAALELSP